MNGNRGCVWIQGAGELASGVAWRLIRCGYRVVMAEITAPVAVRRLVVFAEVVYSDRAYVEGVPGQLYPPDAAAFRAGEVAVCIDPSGNQIPRLQPAVVVDARMTKKPPVPLPVGETPVIGLGPGFRCGYDAVYVVETHREARMGELLSEGEALPSTGTPGAVMGVAGQRVLRAPADGRLQPLKRIGDLVRSGEAVATVGGLAVQSRIDGLLRGLVHPQAELSAGVKVGDVDPRGAAVDPSQVSDKCLAVAGGVLEGLLRLGVVPRDPV